MIQHPNIHLTPREKEILNILLTRAPSNKQIGKTLGITESMVKVHMTHLLKKFNAQTRSQLIIFATQMSTFTVLDE